MKTRDPLLYFACTHCGTPNPSSGAGGAMRVVCHGCFEPTPGPSSRYSGRVLSHASGETCPFFCSESLSRQDRLCGHTSVDLPAIEEQGSGLPKAALLGVFAASALLGAVSFLSLL